MDRLNKFVRSDGMGRLPPGFRFEPTEEELVFQYLKCKVLSCALPASIIAEVNVCSYDPWDLPPGGEEDKYMFSKSSTEAAGNGNGTKRWTPSGYWKARGCDKTIVSSTSSWNSNSNAASASASASASVVGMKKTLVFYTRKPAAGYSRTAWIMHEYRLVSPNPKNIEGQMEKWVLCRIFSKKIRMRNEKERVYDHLMGSCSMSSSSSSSGSVSETEITSTRSAPQETASHDFSSN